jgi:hypothetical protein
LLKAAAEECAEPLQTELLHADRIPVRVTQYDPAPLQLAANIVHQGPKRERVLAYALEGANSAQVRHQQQAARQQVLRKRCALQCPQLNLAPGTQVNGRQKDLCQHECEAHECCDAGTRKVRAQMMAHVAQGRYNRLQVYELDDRGPHAIRSAA